MVRQAIRTVAPRFSARRMLVEYIHRLYRGATGGAMNYGHRIGLGGGNR